MKYRGVLIIDFGSQYTQLIARRVREHRVYCEIHPPTHDIEWVRAQEADGIILSGGPASVYDKDVPTANPALLELDVPVLGICYGMNLLVHLAGGVVSAADAREYGRADVSVDENDALFRGVSAAEPMQVWMSHGDRVEELPKGFRATGQSTNAPIAAVAHESRPLFGVQFHPEVSHTIRGDEVLANFLFGVCACTSDWTPGHFVATEVARIRALVPDDQHVICGLSGGVDSSVAAVLVHRAVGDRLTCIFVDHGLLRRNEREQVERTFRRHYGINLRVVDAADRFLAALEGVEDPEEKRRTIGHVFIDTFEAAAKDVDGDVRFLVQGTLYPDVIESASATGGPSVTIKTHHNVGGLRPDLPFELIEPLRELFKDEVRQVGRELGLPEELVGRHPFPGPGLAIRILGAVTRDSIEMLQRADALYIEALHDTGLYNDIWQAFAVLLPVRSVGVMGDYRTYEHVVALRAVTSRDGMTADWYHFPPDVLGGIATRIINEVPGVNRVVYDVSSKPPATIEWE